MLGRHETTRSNEGNAALEEEAIDAHHSDSFNDFISEYADVLDVGMHGTEATCDSDFKDDLNALLGIRNDGHEIQFISGNPVGSHFGNSQRLDETMEQNEDEVLGIGSTTFDDISAESSVSYECFSCGGTFAQYDVRVFQLLLWNPLDPT
ncbi:hypothetical protein BCR33DRAFT_350306 [Rhizoclosmatium globosum]|uniref:Uncharacterized protein n=1 Tax=Rhizoclosmatium globosum TaxID=329046 RepID=A0A1Y2C1S9_9FUNG|nr:hypothetical protein BCR33DRAFT_350306 [Rhizoclosmatium globosum]|eukprot:ORY40969.1 hypothetical protein BCR33DRAFT_350306 [Rhizoclosmatium globosum]